MKILVLGGGAMGKVIAVDLALAVPRATVRVADVRDLELPVLTNLEPLKADLSDLPTLVRLMRQHDLIVGALPSRLGFAAYRAAIEAERNLVDVSFAAEDPLALDTEARSARITIVPDCGVAPGLSNLLVGRMVATRGTPEEITIYVGGVAEDPGRPYGYVVTWSLDDLLEEYVRPPRVIRDGRVAMLPALSGLEQVEIEGIGRMEAFYSDGLRSLLETVPGVKQMGEKALRWPGHLAAVQPLLASGRMVEELRARCTADPPRDLLVLVVVFRWGSSTEEAMMVDRYDPTSGLTAMARTTALTTSTVARLAVQRGLEPHGVVPMERLGQDEKTFRFVIDAMAGRGVRFSGSALAPANAARPASG